jgi:sigma-E factor negative regulatory protein RseC
MLEQTGRVVAVGNGFAIVETAPRTACGSCRVEGACGAAGLAHLLGRRRDPVRIVDHLGLAPGDNVVLGLQAAMLMRAAAVAYGAPLVGLVLGSMLAAGIGLPEGMVALASGVGLVAGFAWLRLRPVRGDAPVLLARESAAGSVITPLSAGVGDRQGSVTITR